MGLIESIKREQTRKKEKRPRRRDAMAVVCALVFRYGLSEDFAGHPGTSPEIPDLEVPIKGVIRPKKPLELVPFPFVDPITYRIARRIGDAAGNNPYLEFAHSPEEITLSRSLFLKNPDINPELLETLHFETLLVAEEVQRKRRELGVELEKTHKKAGKKKKRIQTENAPDEDYLRSKIEALSELIDFIENRKKGRGKDAG